MAFLVRNYFLIVSTIVVDGRLFASETVINLPVLASRPIFRVVFFLPMIYLLTFVPEEKEEPKQNDPKSKKD